VRGVEVGFEEGRHGEKEGVEGGKCAGLIEVRCGEVWPSGIKRG
jgi:hypothetical protein